MIIWLTGQPGSGKTTIAQRLPVDARVDGDDLRKSMPNPGYNREGRHINIDRAQAIAAWLADSGKTVAVALVAPYREQRERFKAYRGDVIEVYLHYDRSIDRGRLDYWVDDYEPPDHPDQMIDTGRMSEKETVKAVMLRAGLPG